jgi:hypothetical protein
MPSKRGGREVGPRRRDGGGPPVTILVQESDDFARLVAAINREEQSKQLKKDLRKLIREALKPAQAHARSSIMGMGGGTKHKGPSIRASISRKVSIQVQMTKRTAGASVRTRKLKGVRGFVNAPKLTNRKKWRHPQFGDKEVWIDQIGKPLWFDDAMKAQRDDAMKAVREAMEKMAKRMTT